MLNRSGPGDLWNC